LFAKQPKDQVNPRYIAKVMDKTRNIL